MQKKTLIIGSSGSLGKSLVKNMRCMTKVYATFNTNRIDLEGVEFYQLDITNASRVNKLLKDIKPSIVINVAAERRIGYCEKNPNKSYIVNVEGTENIVNACKEINAKMVFISSDQVFDGKKKKYNEDDKINPLNTYGKQKMMAEQIIKNNLKDWLIIRASTIYGWSPKRDDFVSWVLDELQNEHEIQIFDDQYITPIFSDNFADILIRLLENNKTGIYHVGEECLSKYEFVKKIAKVFGFSSEWVKPISSEAFDQIIKRPKYNCLDLTKIKNELDFSKYSIKNGLEIMKMKEVKCYV